MRNLTQLACLLAICVLSYAAAMQAHAADDSVVISRFNKNTLIVNAPANDQVPASLMRKLDVRVTVNFQDVDLVNAIDQFQKLTGVNVVVGSTLRSDNDRRINLTANNMKASSLITWIKQLGGIHVSYMNEAVYFSQEKPSGTRKIRIYDVSDLVMPLQHFPGPKMNIPSTEGGEGQLVSSIAEQEETDADDIIDVLKESLAHRGIEAD